MMSSGVIIAFLFVSSDFVLCINETSNNTSSTNITVPPVKVRMGNNSNVNGANIPVKVITNKPDILNKPSPTSNNTKIIAKDNKQQMSSKEKNTTMPISEKAKQISKNVTTTKKPDKNLNRNAVAERRFPKENLSFDITCTCDLQRYVCDINCCCDSECNDLDKKVFEYCQIDKNRYYDDSFCNYAQHIYINNTSFQWEVNQNGMFCVVRNNQPKSYIWQKTQPLKFLKSAEFEKHGEMFWNYFDQTINPIDSNQMKTNVYGDRVWVLEKNDHQKSFALPKSYMTSSCIYDEDILYLKNSKTICGQTNIDEENVYLNLGYYVRDKKFISQPQFLVNITKSSNFKGSLYEACPKSLCHPIEAYVCDPSYLNCKLYDANITSFTCSIEINKSIMNCLNAVQKIHYNFIHNGSIGLTKVEVKAVLQNFSFPFETEDFEFNQEFVVNFKWTYETENASDILSGNPGYIIGKPIIIGTYFLQGNTSVIVRNSTKFVDNFLTLPAIRNGECVSSDTDYTPIEFGYNYMLKCRFLEELSVVNNKSFRANESCQIIQRKILESLRIPVHINKTYAVGLFGNAHSLDKNSWSEILFETSPFSFINSTFGNFTNQNKTLKCFGILTSISIDLLYSRVDFKDLLNQNKILALEYKFRNLKNMSFSVRNNVRADLDMRFGMKIEFFDITKEKKKKYVEAPSIKIKLPYDFFYPFVKIDNSSSSHRTERVFIVLVFYFVLWWL